jgi:hypothetical protein
MTPSGVMPNAAATSLESMVFCAVCMHSARQFLDIGSGLPTVDNNTHEVAQRAPSPTPGSSMSTMTRSCSSTRGAAGQQPGRHDRLHPGRPAGHPDDSRRGRADPGLQPVGRDRAHRGPALHTGRRGSLPGHAPACRCGPVRQLRPEAPVTGPLTWLKRRGTYTPVC